MSPAGPVWETPGVAIARWNALLLTGLGLALVLGPLGWRVLRLSGALERGLALGGVALYVAWLLAEGRISAGEVRREAPSEDGRSMELAAAAKITFLLVTLLAGGAPAPATAVPGLALLAGGVALRTWAIARLGACYSHRVRTPEQVIAAGPYAWLRHPAYAGTLVAHLGVALVFAGPASLAAWAVLWLPAVVWRVIVEERCLARSPEWREYAAGRARLVPGVW